MATAAERQKAYRERQKSGNVTPPRERAPRGRTVKTPTLAALKKDVTSILEMANALAFSIGLAADALSPDEIAILANGVAHELKEHPEWVRKLSAMMSGVSAHGVMAAAVLAVALPRLSRRGIVPWTVAQPLTGLAYMIGGQQPNAHEPTKHETYNDPVPLEAEPSPGSGRGQREWEVDPGGEVAG